MTKEVDPKETGREKAFALWMQAANPMVTLIKTLDVTDLVRAGRKRRLKFNMLMDYCIGKAASAIPEFYLLPVRGKLIQYDTLAVNTIVLCRRGEICSCDIRFSGDLDTFNHEYLTCTGEAAEKGVDRDLSAECMVIGTSAVPETELDGAVGIYSGQFNNPFLIWGRYRKKMFRYTLPVSFQFHHTQMDGAQAGRFLESLQNTMHRI